VTPWSDVANSNLVWRISQLFQTYFLK